MTNMFESTDEAVIMVQEVVSSEIARQKFKDMEAIKDIEWERDFHKYFSRFQKSCEHITYWTDVMDRKYAATQLGGATDIDWSLLKEFGRTVRACVETYRVVASTESGAHLYVDELDMEELHSMMETMVNTFKMKTNYPKLRKEIKEIFQAWQKAHQEYENSLGL